MKYLMIVSLVFCSFVSEAQNSVHLTFHNGSFKSIPLLIPGVMNPNLSPLSNSGLELAYGQEVYYFMKGDKRKKTLLFTVDERFHEGEILEIDELIKQTH
jgi:hypothetical protein